MILEPHPTWKIKDSSKLDDWCACRRLYFYRHILGWRPDIPAHDLHFGECWHIAREYGLTHGYEDVEGAYNVFIEKYREQFPPHTDELYSPKTPTAVLKALMELAKPPYIYDLRDNEVVIIDNKLMTEIAGTVPISKDRVLYYRMDSIMRNIESGKIFSWDHKTTSERYINSRTWEEQFFLGIQNGTYTHCLFCLFPIEQVLGVEFYGVGFAKTIRDSKLRPAGAHVTFKKVSAFKTPEQMNVWLWNVNQLYEEIESEVDFLMSNCSENDELLNAFPLNPKSCMSYRGCSYFDFCMAWTNPLQRCAEPPTGFRSEFWNPAEKESKNILNLEGAF